MGANHISVFVGSTIAPLERAREDIKKYIRLLRWIDQSIETIPAGMNRRTELERAILTSDIFIGIYGTQMPMDSSQLWREELNIAIEHKTDGILLFRQHSNGNNSDTDEVWQKVRAKGLIVPTFREHEELLLQICHALAFQTPSIPQSGKETYLSRIFDLGPPPYYIIYGRRASSARQSFGSLQTAKNYFDTYQRVRNHTPNVAVEPEIPPNIFEHNGVMLLSGPPTSDWSKEYFDRLHQRGIRLFSGSCRNHLNEECKQKGPHCEPGRDRNATGCVHVNDEERVYTFRDSQPAKHVAMLVRTPSPWGNSPQDGSKESYPSVVYAAGCHSQSGLLACSCITDEQFMQELLVQIGCPAESNIPLWFVAVISQVSNQNPVVEYAGRIQIKSKEEWRIEPPLNYNRQMHVRDHSSNEIDLSPKTPQKSKTGVSLFVSYAHKDEKHLVELSKHLTVLERQGLITTWHDSLINPGEEWEATIDRNLDSADIILLLVSPDFINSNYCNDKEMRRAMERHEQGECVVIPIILRPAMWRDTPISKLQVLPTGGKPIIKWDSRDSAFVNVTEGIKSAINDFLARRDEDHGVEHFSQ